MPPALAIPLIICFCAITYTIRTGISAIKVPAIKSANEVLCSAWKYFSPSWSVLLLLEVRKISGAR